MKKIIKYSLDFDIDSLASALHISKQAALEEFQDGRVAARFAEHWASHLFHFIKHPSNYPRSDGKIKTNGIGDIEISVKTLTHNGVKFQRSKHVGMGRTCTKDDLINSLSDVDRFCIVDITTFPNVKIILISSQIIMGWVVNNQLTPSGISKTKFYDLIGDQLCPD